MKTNIFKLSFMALAAIAFATSCSQDEEITMVGTEQPNVLDISATVKEYTPDAETRVTDAGNDADYTTSFENDDCIGVYVIVNGETVIENKQLKYNAAEGKWAPPTDSDTPLYYYKDAQYIAYSPYTELALASGEEKTIAEKIKDYFVETVWTAAATKDNYKSCDLMIATYSTGDELPSAGNVNAAFEFSHVMSMVEYWIPAKTYNTEEDGTGYSYSGVPMSGLKFEMKTVAGWQEVTPASIDGIRFRILLDPDAEGNKDMLFGGQFNDNGAPVYFRTENAFAPAAGTYKKVTVTRGGYSFAPSYRPIEVGDYYYSDGNIVPSSESTIPAEINGAKCIGIVYSTDMADTDTGKENGYVVSISSVNTKWNFDTTNQYISVGDGGLTSADFSAIKDGYTRTKSYSCSEFLETNFTKVNNNTSGWYIPAPAQFVEMLVNLGEYEPGENEDYTANNSQARIDAIKKLKDKIENISGEEFGEFTWMCIESSSANMWAFQSKENKGNPFFNGGRKKDTSYNLRPVLAF